MIIDNTIFESATGLKVPQKISFKNTGLSYHQLDKMISFLDNAKFISEIEGNSHISGLFTTTALRHLLKRNDIQYILVDDPRLYFYRLYNFFGRRRYLKTPTIIDHSAVINRFAYVSDYNVVIGKNVVIEPHVTILPDVIIGDNCTIRAGAVIGCEGFEHKRTSEGLISIFHNGKVIIGSNVAVGSNTCISKGFMSADTIIGDNTKLDNLVHIGHSVQIGKNCICLACAMIASSTRIEDNVWFGSNDIIKSRIHLDHEGYVTIGSTRN